MTLRNAATKCSKRLGKQPLSKGVVKCFLQTLKSFLTILCKNDLTCQFILIALCEQRQKIPLSLIFQFLTSTDSFFPTTGFCNFTIVPQCLEGWSGSPCTWGGQVVFLLGDTVPQVPRPAAIRALGSHWPGKLA